MRSILVIVMCCSLAACVGKNRSPIVLQRALSLNYPSASTIEFIGDDLMIIGDDAPYAIILETNGHLKQKIQIAADTSRRVSKETKFDIEASCSMRINGIQGVLAIGSYSTSARTRCLFFPEDDPAQFADADSVLRYVAASQGRLNIEGATRTSQGLLLADRANESQPVNELIQCDWNNGNPTPNWFASIILPKRETGIAGVSGLHYNITQDRLYFTASVERTRSAIEDGEVLGSYIGWFDHFSQYKSGGPVKPDAFIWLENIDKVFAKQKIESILVYADKSPAKVWLVSDDDNGGSVLFQLTMPAAVPQAQ